MATTFNPGTPDTYHAIAGADLSTHQYKALKLQNGFVVPGVDGDTIVGVLQDNPAAQGNASFVILGACPVLLGENVSENDELGPLGDSTFGSTSVTPCARALESGSSGDTILAWVDVYGGGGTGTGLTATQVDARVGSQSILDAGADDRQILDADWPAGNPDQGDLLMVFKTPGTRGRIEGWTRGASVDAWTQDYVMYIVTGARTPETLTITGHGQSIGVPTMPIVVAVNTSDQHVIASTDDQNVETVAGIITEVTDANTVEWIPWASGKDHGLVTYAGASLTTGDTYWLQPNGQPGTTYPTGDDIVSLFRAYSATQIDHEIRVDIAPAQLSSTEDYRHDQVSASVTWTMTHNRTTEVVESVRFFVGGQPVDTNWTVTSTSVVTATFATPQAGFAIIEFVRT